MRAKPNNDLDVEAQLAEYEGEFVNVVDTAKKTDHYAVREFLALDNGNWYRVEGQGKQEKSDGYVREDEMAVSRDHKPFSAPLFKRPPQVSDVQQGALGDCFLLALPDAMINQYFRSVSFEARPDPHANLQPLLGRLGKAEASAQTRDRALQYFAHLANATSPEVDSAAARDLLQRLADGASLVPGLPSAERRRLAEQARALL